MAFDIKQHLNDDRVSVLAPPKGLRLTREHTVNDALELMQANRSGCVMICEGEKLVGIFTERDYLRRVLGDGASPQTPLSDAYTQSPKTINEKSSVADLIRMIHAGRFRHVPIFLYRKKTNDVKLSAMTIRSNDARLSAMTCCYPTPGIPPGAIGNTIGNSKRNE